MSAKKSSKKARREARKTAQQRKKIVWVVGAVALIGIYFFAFSKPDPQTLVENPDPDHHDLTGQTIQIGATAPDFTLTDLDNNPVTLSNYHDQPVVVTFFHTWWPVCNANAPEFRAAEKKYGDELLILHVSIQETSNVVLDFISTHGLTSTFLLDSFGQIGQNYQIFSTPTTFFINDHGIIQDVTVGYLDINWIADNMEKQTQ